MHYMPWFEAPSNPAVNKQYTWGWHWTMNTRNPNIIDTNGKRQIASHYYPLIGPYASNDPDVLEYHLLLLKFSGVDGVLIDWYGVEGSNDDRENLLKNSNALIDRLHAVGLHFALVIEDRFWSTIDQAKSNLKYIRDHYSDDLNYIHVDGKPLVAIFGPITFQQPAQWNEIFSATNLNVEFLTLWYEHDDAGTAAAGEYAWIYSDTTAGLTNFYQHRAPQLQTAMGVAYPGFHDYYAEGGAGASYFYIPEHQGSTLDKTLRLFDQYKSDLDFLQLATFNDYGEGAVFEPTIENGFAHLARIQRYLDSRYDESDLRNAYKLFLLRKRYQNDPVKQRKLGSVFLLLNNGKMKQAHTLLAAIEKE